MAAIIGQGVTLRGYHFENWHLTFNLATGITKDHEGRAVALDSTGPNKVKLAGDGDPIIGRLEVVENRAQEGILVGTVALKFANRLPIAEGETVAIGNSVQGAGSGEVKALPVTQDTDASGGAVNIVAASHNQRNVVVEVSGTYATVIQF